jgi:hypothetical protein
MNLLENLLQYTFLYPNKEKAVINISQNDSKKLYHQIYLTNQQWLTTLNDSKLYFDGIEIRITNQEAYSAIPNSFEYEIVNKETK